MKRITFFIMIIGCLLICMMGCESPMVSGAKVYMQQKEFDQAIKQCQLAIEQNPNDAEAYFIMGQAYGEKKMYQEMNDAYKKSLEISEKRTSEIKQNRSMCFTTVFNQGVGYVNQGKFEEAGDNFVTSIEILPDRMEAYKNLAYTYTQMDKDTMAIETYLQAIEVNPKDMEIQTFLGMLYFKSGDYNNAIDVLKEVVEKGNEWNKAEKEYKEQYGEDLETLGKMKETLSAEHIYIDPKYYKDALYNIAFSYDLQGESEKAIETYMSSLEVAPNDKDLLFNLGRLYFLQKDYKHAIQYFQRNLELDPLDYEANLNTGNAYSNMGIALSDAADTTDLKGNYVLPKKVRDEKKEASNKNLMKAVEYYKTAIGLSPLGSNVWTNLAIAYVRIGMRKLGETTFLTSEALNNGDLSHIENDYGIPDEVQLEEVDGILQVTLQYNERNLKLTLSNGQMESIPLK